MYMLPLIAAFIIPPPPRAAEVWVQSWAQKNDEVQSCRVKGQQHIYNEPFKAVRISNFEFGRSADGDAFIFTEPIHTHHAHVPAPDGYRVTEGSSLHIEVADGTLTWIAAEATLTEEYDGKAYFWFLPPEIVPAPFLPGNPSKSHNKWRYSKFRWAGSQVFITATPRADELKRSYRRCDLLFDARSKDLQAIRAYDPTGNPRTYVFGSREFNPPSLKFPSVE